MLISWLFISLFHSQISVLLNSNIFSFKLDPKCCFARCCEAPFLIHPIVRIFPIVLIFPIVPIFPILHCKYIQWKLGPPWKSVQVTYKYLPYTFQWYYSGKWDTNKKCKNYIECICSLFRKTGLILDSIKITNPS